MVVDFSFKINKKTFTLKVKKLTTLIDQSSGLMFKKNSPPLLFIFKKPKRIGIHSLFCKKFIAVWFLKEKIIDIKLIKPNKFLIKPKNKFDRLLEVPSNNPQFKKILNFIDEA